MEFRSIRDALQYANTKVLPKKIDDALNREVFKAVQVTEAVAIKEEVYDVYEPKLYDRRGDWGGMGDMENIRILGGKAKDGRMAVVNRTVPNPGGCIDNSNVTVNKILPELIEYGHNYRGYVYDYPSKKGRYMAPRPFTARTISDLKRSRMHVVGLAVGLRRQGIRNVDF